MSNNKANAITIEHKGRNVGPRGTLAQVLAKLEEGGTLRVLVTNPPRGCYYKVRGYRSIGWLPGSTSAGALRRLIAQERENIERVFADPEWAGLYTLP